MKRLYPTAGITSAILIGFSVLLMTACEKIPMNPYDTEAIDLGYFTTYPELSLSEGIYHKDIEVSITCSDPDALVYYTVDWSEPGTGSSVYEEPIQIYGDGNTTLVKAVAKNPDLNLSGVISASFSIDYLTLTPEASEYGSVSPSSPVNVPQDEPYTLTAVPDGGSFFAGWTVTEGSGVLIDDASSEETTVTLTEEDAAVKANFTYVSYTLTVMDDGNGTTNPSGDVQVGSGVPEAIEAIPQGVYGFDHWSVESGEGVAFGASTEASTTVSLTDGDAAVKANFVPWPELDEIIPSDGVADDWFSSSVAVSGNYAVVGARGDDDDGESSGSAYVFFYNGTEWVQQAKLTADDAAEQDCFGFSVDISGDYLVVGAYWDDDSFWNSGSAYVFHRDGTTWMQQAKLVAGDPADHDHFGFSVALSGDYAIVGSPDDNSSQGSVYVFHRDVTDWPQQQKLTASDGSPGDHFGVSVAVSGEYILAGTAAEDNGAAYIFYYNGSSWTQQAILSAADGSAGDRFGESVAISGDYALVGAYSDDDDGDGSGSAYVFHRDGTTWPQQQKLTASDGAEWDYFGRCVSIAGDHIVIGATGDDDNGDGSGSAYVFHRDGAAWSQQAKLTPSDGEPSDYFGGSVSLSGEQAFVGARFGNVGGSVYIFGGE